MRETNIKKVEVSGRDIIKLSITVLEYEIQKYESEFAEMCAKGNRYHRYAKELTAMIEQSTKVIDELRFIWPNMSHWNKFTVNESDAHLNH